MLTQKPELKLFEIGELLVRTVSKESKNISIFKQNKRQLNVLLSLFSNPKSWKIKTS